MSKLRLTLILALLLALVAPVAAQTPPPAKAALNPQPLPPKVFMVGLTGNQTARLNFVAFGKSPASIEFKFMAQDGSEFGSPEGSVVLNPPPGQIFSHEVSLQAGTPRQQIVAMVKIVGPADADGLATLEIMEGEKIKLVLNSLDPLGPGAKDPFPGQRPRNFRFRTLGPMSSRVNTIARVSLFLDPFVDTRITEDEANPTIIEVSFLDANGLLISQQEVTLKRGHVSFVDLVGSDFNGLFTVFVGAGGVPNPSFPQEAVEKIYTVAEITDPQSGATEVLLTPPCGGVPVGLK